MFSIFTSSIKPKVDKDELERVSLEEMKLKFANVECTTIDFGFELDDLTYLRYLRARNYDVNKAADMLHATIKWREDIGLKDIHNNWNDIMKNENDTGKMYVRGFDKENHVIMYMTPKFENTNNHDNNVKHVIYNMERACWVMKKNGKGAEKMSLLIDYDGFSILNAPPYKTSMETLSILQNHYPERLFRAYCISPPFLFTSFYSMISPFIDTITKEKLVMVNSNVNTALNVTIDLENLEERFGGLDKKEFNSSLYLKSPFDSDYNENIKSLEK